MAGKTKAKGEAKNPSGGVFFHGQGHSGLFLQRLRCDVCFSVDNALDLRSRDALYMCICKKIVCASPRSIPSTPRISIGLNFTEK